jgi:hypothetical protein
MRKCETLKNERFAQIYVRRGGNLPPAPKTVGFKEFMTVEADQRIRPKNA